VTGDPWAALRDALTQPTPELLAACGRIGQVLAVAGGDDR